MASSSFLCGKIALITGGGGTIGQAIASALVKQGASVVLAGRSLERLEQARDRIVSSEQQQERQHSNAATSSHPADVSVISCDVTLEQSVQEMFHKLDQQYNNGGIDLLINNAGVMTGGETTELSGDDFEWVMKVNVLGPFLCAREALKRMKNW